MAIFLSNRNPTICLQKSHQEQSSTTPGSQQVEAGVMEQAAVGKCKLGLSSSSWTWSSVWWYNRLLADIRAEKSLNNFKSRLKIWVAVNKCSYQLNRKPVITIKILQLEKSLFC